MKSYSAALLLTALLMACGQDDQDATPHDPTDMGADSAATQDMPAGSDMVTTTQDMPGTTVSPRDGIFGAGVTEVTLEIDYQTGAAPFTGRSGLTGDTWDMFKNNATRLFKQASPRTLTIPTTLAQMEELTDLTKTDLSAQDLLDLAAAHREGTSTAAHRRFYVVFLDARFRDKDDQVRDDVLGVSIGDTGVIAMFKPVINSTGSARLIEQTTLVHELGHALGLVNNGITLTSTHHDAEHGAHCSNRDCIMYYLNESASGIEGFVGGLLGGDAPIVFGAECLQDVDAAAAAR
jgi:predicted Zn-dependent protease